MNVNVHIASLLIAASAVSTTFAQSPVDDSEGLTFFEKRIRPVLVERCYQCHSADAKKSKGGLQLDSRDGLLRGGDTGPAIAPGAPDESLLIEAIEYRSYEMPPDGRLEESVIADFRRWIDMGAPDPRQGGAAADAKTIDLKAAAEFWSFRALEGVSPPEIANPSRAANDIDRFILAALDERGLAMSAEADRQTLIRRLYIDLVGLPPTIEEQREFVESTDERAYEKLVDRLLASRHFGERWGRHWLDLARYADSTGGGTSSVIPEAWHYRDYVIASFNADKPFDQFIREQIAGDLLPNRDADERAENLIATGFLALGPRNYVTDDELPFRMDGIDEQVDTVGRVFLGMTIGCARCHDHKFDPIPTTDYYALAGIFDSTVSYEPVPGSKNFSWNTVGDPRSVDPAEFADYRERLAVVGAMKDRWKAIDDSIVAAAQSRVPPPGVSPEGLDAWIAEATRDMNAMKAEEAAARKSLPRKPETLLAVASEGSPRDMRVRIRGNPTREGPLAPRGFLSVVSSAMPSGADEFHIPTGESGRLQLAEWIASKDNPLTARVFVNRVWHHLLGRGLVRGVDNFGATGEPPTHPELLDWLAARFLDDGRSIKSLVRLIALSRTYRQSVADEVADQRLLAIDPDNLLFGRRARRGLDAETLRDCMLAVSGELDLKPADGREIEKLKQEYDHSFDEATRSVYVPRFRNHQLELFQTFDAANPSLVVGQRDQTIMPTQALYLINANFVRERSIAAARRLLNEPGLTDAERVERMFRLTLCRPPYPSELEIASDFLLGTGEASAEERLEAWSALQRTLFECVDYRFVQ